jgi:hypothetical protein
MPIRPLVLLFDNSCPTSHQADEVVPTLRCGSRGSLMPDEETLQGGDPKSLRDETDRGL